MNIIHPKWDQAQYCVYMYSYSIPWKAIRGNTRGIVFDTAWFNRDKTALSPSITPIIEESTILYARDNVWDIGWKAIWNMEH